MQLDRRPRLVDGKLPVFVFPTELVYYADDRSSHKQVLTVYNPYDFTLKFKVLCTTRRKYAVVDSEGTVRPGCCVDVVIRHKEIKESSYGVRDKFRLNIYEHGRRDAIGSKDIPTILLPTSQGREKESDELSSTPGEGSTNMPFTAVARQRQVTPGPTVVLLALVCVVALLLPMQGEAGSSLPLYLHLTVNQKLIAAYVLGLVTMVILRT
ncbi:motile sperm domain-containing protein 1-like [Acanthaster planci]|uniref:Motile sperm domain-containing protein 1 n=1 Tax=Acanthaster planci TaxID=133434 RepID=A0A8B7YS91_ACAPL|nr:motile sperm domain-containing protein 1-like [Acanthaster planci]